MANRRYSRLIWSIGIITVLMVCGTLMAWRLILHAENEMKTDRLQKAKTIAQTLNINHVISLTGTPSDCNRPEYLRLKNQLNNIASNDTNCRFIYLVGRRPDGKVFFFVDNEPPGSADESPAGQIYDDIPEAFLTIFDSKKPQFVGPVTDRWGSWVTSLVPIFTPGTDTDLVAVLGMDMAAEDWRAIRFREALPPFVLTFSLVVLFLVCIKLSFITQRIKIPFGTVIVGFFGMTLALFAAWVSYDHATHSNHKMFRRLANEKSAALRNRLHTLRNVELKGLAGFLENSKKIDLDEYQRYSNHLSLNPYVQAWSWVPAVPENEKQLFEKRLQSEGLSDYRIWETTPGRDRIPAKKRQFYYPVSFLSPVEKNKSALGYDIGSDPIRKKALEAATQTGLVTCSDPIILVQDTESQQSILILHPVFTTDGTKNLRGFAVAVLRMADVLHSAGPDDVISLALSFTKSDSSQIKLVDSRSDSNLSNQQDSLVTPITAFGRTFFVHAFSGPKFDHSHPKQTGLLVLFSGMALTVALVFAVSASMSRRRQLEELVANRTAELAESTERFEQLAEQSRSFTWEVDSNGLYTYVGQTAFAILGYKPEELVGTMHYYDLHPETERQQFKQRTLKAFTRREHFRNFENRAVTKAGQPIWLNTTGFPMTDSAGNLTGYRGSDTEITERKQLEKSLHENQARLDLALQSAEMGAWEWNIVEDRRYFDTRVCHLLGIDPEKFQGSAEEFFNAIHPSDRETLKNALNETINDGSPYRPVYRTVWPDASIHYISAHGKLIRDRTGNPIKILGLVSDITEIKLAQQRLEEERQRLAHVIQGTRAGIWEWNIQTGETIFNEKWAEIIGYTLEELSPVSIETWASHAHPEDLKRSGELLEKHFSGELPFYDCQCRMKHKNGHWVWIYDRGQVRTWTEDGKPLLMFGTHMDITKAKQAEKELLETNKQLEAETARANAMVLEAEMATIAKSEFLANMSHEIRTPMNGVIGMTGLLLDTDLTPAQRHYAENVRASGESLIYLINDILDFSKIEAGKLELEIIDFDLRRLMDDLASTLAAQAHGKHLELVCGITPKTPVLLRGDPGRLNQILTNLIGNAIKFTDSGEVVIIAEMVSEASESILIRFSVKDSGIGIPEEKLNILFDNFSQVDASTTRQYGGTGLGLAISRQLAEMMGGEIGIISREGEGSEFWFTAAFQKQTRAVSYATEAPVELKGSRILIVDDNSNNRKLIASHLQALGVAVEEAENASDGLISLYRAYALNDPFQIAFIDMEMPEMNGEDMGLAIRAQKEMDSTRIVLLGPLNFYKNPEDLARAGFNGYLPKPIKISEIKNIIYQALTKPIKNDGLQPFFTRQAEQDRIATHPVFSGRVLIVEDNFTNQQVAIGLLNKFGLTADAAANGSEALALLSSMPYDIVLMDIQMPEMDGYEATYHIRNPESAVLNHNIPIIAITANALSGDREKCLKCGMDDYITKPIDPASLDRVLKSFLAPEKVTAKDTEPDRHHINKRAIWDREAMMNRLMHDNDLADKLLEGFLIDIPDQIEQLESFILNKGMADIECQAHKIKGASSYIGGERLEDVAGAIEKAGREGESEIAASYIPDLKKCFDLLAKEIETGLKR